MKILNLLTIRGVQLYDNLNEFSEFYRFWDFISNFLLFFYYYWNAVMTFFSYILRRDASGAI